MMLFVYLLISGAIIALDQFVKFWTISNLELGEVQSWIPNFISLTYIQNTGAAWSILEGQMWFFYIITIAAVAAAVYFLVKYLHESKWLTIGISLCLAGAIGNFVDRIRLGFVVDMFKTDFISFPIFNIADMSLVIGVFLIFIYVFLEERKEKKNGSN